MSLSEVMRQQALRAMWVLLACLTFPGSAMAVMGEPPAGFSADEALRLGERIYRQGVLPSGAPVKAVVHGDVEVDGRMFTCVSCHMSSGLGSVEGPVITLPTSGGKLYSPLPWGQELKGTPPGMLPLWHQKTDRRPAYGDATLAIALRWGVDPAGRLFDWVMPRYFLEDRDMGLLIFYLKNLSAEYSPGVTDTTIRFATVVSEDVSPEDRAAMIEPLRLYVRARNSRSKAQMRKRYSGRFVEEMDRAFRRLELTVWELKGDPSGWKRQLEDASAREPVFAVLGGLTSGEWEPVHRFCEERRIPCLFPVTDFPVISDTDRYTLYFSKGLYQEGEAAARYLGGGAFPADVPVVQIYRDERRGHALSRGFRETWTRAGGRPVEDRIVGDKEIGDRSFWLGMLSRHKGAVFLIWLGELDPSVLELLSAAQGRPAMIFLPGSMAGPGLLSLPEAARGFTYITYPHQLPDALRAVYGGVSQWMKAGGTASSNPMISAQMYAVGKTLTEMLMHMRNDFFRDYFLDVVDMMQDQTLMSALYPRLSFGPGQRYASKGCYIVQVTAGGNPKLHPLTDWVVH